jgi:ParB family chromosome partitioning protein
MEICELDPAKLKVDKTNERRTNINAQTEGGDLEKSIEENGVVFPIYVRKVDGGLKVIAGQRRMLAAQAVGEETIPAIKINADESEARAISIMENDEQLQKSVPRKDRARATKAYVSEIGGKAAAAKNLGVSKQTIENRLETTKSFWKETEFGAETESREKTEEIPDQLLARLRSVINEGEQAEEIALQIIEDKVPRNVVSTALTNSDTRTQLEEKLDRLHYKDDTEEQKEIDIDLLFEGKKAEVLTRYAKELGTTPEDTANRLLKESLDDLSTKYCKGNNSEKLDKFTG